MFSAFDRVGTQFAVQGNVTNLKEAKINIYESQTDETTIRTVRGGVKHASAKSYQNYIGRAHRCVD
jgi:hypothetical protein